MSRTSYLYAVSRFIFFHFRLQIGEGETIKFEKSYINPWSASTVKDLLKKLNTQIIKYDVRQYSLYLLLSFAYSNLLNSWCCNCFLTHVSGIPSQYKSLYRKSDPIFFKEVIKEQDYWDRWCSTLDSLTLIYTHQYIKLPLRI